jgi:hypothetical protein
MSFTEIQLEIATLAPDFRRKLIGFMVMLEIHENKNEEKELKDRLEDVSSESWISLEEVKRRLSQIA